MALACAGVEFAVEHEHARVELDRAHDDLLELALAHHELRVDPVAHLDDRVDHLDARRARELAQLAHALFGGAHRGRAAALVADVDQDRAAVLRLDLARPARRANSASRSAMSFADVHAGRR